MEDEHEEMDGEDVNPMNNQEDGEDRTRDNFLAAGLEDSNAEEDVLESLTSSASLYIRFEVFRPGCSVNRFSSSEFRLRVTDSDPHLTKYWVVKFRCICAAGSNVDVVMYTVLDTGANTNIKVDD
ncbi:uncharacterized protein A4U43_C06F9780 [Asparagus officinalis]|uniref:Uncharacterized protein n=1 Tax=Asparagus officinalis TaxID=4686 RepID=A0A5P1EN59_ASPOF|nr:uncharacterized protein A4U43_C06F9780 [Asparagus officinalis]